jgi:hypothetical protein
LDSIVRINTDGFITAKQIDNIDVGDGLRQFKVKHGDVVVGLHQFKENDDDVVVRKYIKLSQAFTNC